MKAEAVFVKLSKSYGEFSILCNPLHNVCLCICNSVWVMLSLAKHKGLTPRCNDDVASYDALPWQQVCVVNDSWTARGGGGGGYWHSKSHYFVLKRPSSPPELCLITLTLGQSDLSLVDLRFSSKNSKSITHQMPSWIEELHRVLTVIWVSNVFGPTEWSFCECLL